MDDFRLRVFIAAAKSLSFTRCAEQLYISQPAVSKHIGELESRYKAQLFERHGSRLVLTDAGRTLLAYAERITDEYRKLQYEMSLKTDREGGRLRLGASSTIAQYLLPRVLARFTVRFPDVRVSLISGNSQQIEQALETVYAPDENGESPELEAAAALVASRYRKKLADGRRDLVVAALQRRGFAYAVIKEAIRRTEEEL